MKFLRNLILSFVFAGAMSLTTSANAACKVHLGDLTGIVLTFILLLQAILLKKDMAAKWNQQKEVLLQ